MNQVILCAIDVSFPEHELPVLQRAVRYLKSTDDELHIVTVVPELPHFSIGHQSNDQAVAAARDDVFKRQSELLETVLGSGTDPRVRLSAHVGKTYSEILAAAEEVGANLIVLGAHRPDMQSYYLGTTASRVTRHANCSVYVVRH